MSIIQLKSHNALNYVIMVLHRIIIVKVLL